ncbi:MAG: DUF1064 domain-containing protein [Bacteroidetes bacterium]|nr:DUF1064 domain-containing protein [Bacteroidota bacterium]
MKSKYNARKTIVVDGSLIKSGTALFKSTAQKIRVGEIDGIIFDSYHEAEYYLYLYQQRKEGRIDAFERQVRFDLIPSQKGERPVFYKADFVTWRRGERLDVIDCKGMRLPVYVIKRKLMLQVHGIKIKEV